MFAGLLTDQTASSYCAYLCVQGSSDIAWRSDSAGSLPVSFSEDGTYSVSYQMQKDSDGITALILSTDLNAYTYAPADASAQTILSETSVRLLVRSVSVLEASSGNRTDWTYTGPSEAALALNDDGKTLRLNLWNPWQEPAIADLSSTRGTNSGSFLPDTPLQAGDILTVTVTVSGMTGSEEEEDKSRGDVDGDGSITLADATLALTAYSEASVSNPSPLTEEQAGRADVDQNGEITLSDATLILTYYAQSSVGNHPSWKELLS